MLQTRTQNIAFVKMLPVLQAGPGRQVEEWVGLYMDEIVFFDFYTTLFASCFVLSATLQNTINLFLKLKISCLAGIPRELFWPGVCKMGESGVMQDINGPGCQMNQITPRVWFRYKASIYVWWQRFQMVIVHELRSSNLMISAWLTKCEVVIRKEKRGVYC